MYVWRNIEARSPTYFCRGNAISITYSQCVSVALVIKHATGMRHIIFKSVACLAVPHSPTLSHKRHDFWGEKILNTKIMVWFSQQLLSEAFPILRIIQRDIVTNVRKSSCKVPVIHIRIFMKLEYFQQIFEKYSDIKFRETPSSGSRVVPCRQAKGQTDRHDEANSRFSTRLKICQMEVEGLGLICISYSLYICALRDAFCCLFFPSFLYSLYNISFFLITRQ